MGSWKTSLKHRFRIRCGNRERRFHFLKKNKLCNGKYKAMKKCIWCFQIKDSCGDGYTIKFKLCYRKFSTRKWRSLAQSSKICWECHLHSPFWGVFWGSLLFQLYKNQVLESREVPSNLRLQSMPQQGLFMSKYPFPIDHRGEHNGSALCPIDTSTLHHKLLLLAVPALESPKEHRVDSRTV